MATRLQQEMFALATNDMEKLHTLHLKDLTKELGKLEDNMSLKTLQYRLYMLGCFAYHAWNGRTGTPDLKAPRLSANPVD